jgi:serine/threonine protein kinase
MIEKLANHPHEHITPYLATWIRGGVPCILFPRAKYNLRTFMSTTEEPKMTQSFVLWFLEQLKGLAGAVDHFHWIGEERSAPGTSRGANRDQSRLGHDLKTNQKKMGLAGLHHDLKAENILIFEKQATDSRPAGVFKISDFGAGRFADLALGEISAPVKAARGTLTYKAPDEKPSRPFDLWALGCVFLELLIWAVTPEQDGGKGFSHRRGWMSNHEPGPAEQTYPDDAFWLLDPVTHKPKLRWSVSQQIEDLEKIHCEGKKAFTRVTQLTSKLFTIDPGRRPRAKEVLEEMERIYKEAAEDLEADPYCCTRHHTRKTSGSLSAADALHIHATPVTLKPEGSPARSLKRPLHEDDDSESEQEPAPFRKLRRQSSDTNQVPSVFESVLDILGTSQSAALDVQGAESEDDDLRHIRPEDMNRRRHHANEETNPRPWPEQPT